MWCIYFFVYSPAPLTFTLFYYIVFIGMYSWNSHLFATWASLRPIHFPVYAGFSSPDSYFIYLIWGI